jgi:phosphoglycolate phosphatase
MAKLFIFDLDGTLFDSHDQIIRAANATRAANSLPQIEPIQAVGLVGLPARKLFPEEGGSETSETERLVSEFRMRLAEEVRIQNNLFEGVESFVKLLRCNGALIAVATSKPTWLARLVVANSPLAASLDWIQGTDSFPPKPDPEVILRCIEALNRPKEVFMVGDHAVDMLAARAAGITGIGVSQGSYSADALLSSGAKFAGSNFSKLTEVLLTERILSMDRYE